MTRNCPEQTNSITSQAGGAALRRALSVRVAGVAIGGMPTMLAFVA
ncbi:hypothetical protein Sliba_54860 [Streptomyces nigrescens]|uniref:Uncharacterized protein n=1 Tax=Streptomyces nigrescens TaxID=1920 RepID=A0A640TM91_STRNI|nr:hypothetical protein Sliba_54860 [Streptomyces libani subsp. libani]